MKGLHQSSQRFVYGYISQKSLKCLVTKWMDLPSLDYFLFEAATGGVLYKKVLLEVSQSSQENTCGRVFFLMKLPQQTFQRCFNVAFWLIRRCAATSNQRWNNVVYFNVGIYNIEQCWINVVYFNVDINNVRQRRNNVVIFNVDINNFGNHRNNVVKMAISKKNKTSFQIEYTEFKVLSTIS